MNNSNQVTRIIKLTLHADNSVLKGFWMGDRCSFFHMTLIELILRNTFVCLFSHCRIQGVTCESHKLTTVCSTCSNQLVFHSRQHEFIIHTIINVRLDHGNINRCKWSYGKVSWLLLKQLWGQLWVTTNLTLNATKLQKSHYKTPPLRNLCLKLCHVYVPKRRPLQPLFFCLDTQL